jgi:Xaa-Pro aminopeptidase
VAEIRDFGKNTTFKYVVTNENPAHLATRGISFSQLEESNWFHGPEWITNPPQDWPSWNWEVKNSGSKTKEDMVTNPALPMNTKVEKGDPKYPFDMDLKSYSSLCKLLRVTVYCQRFVNYIKKIKNPKQLHPMVEEMNQARQMWVKVVQEDEYTEVIQHLRKDKLNPLIKQLDLTWMLMDSFVVGGGLPRQKLKKMPNSLCYSQHVITSQDWL